MASPMYYSYTPTMSPTNSTASRICELSPHARALSTVLTAFVGSLVGGITGGPLVAFMTGMFCWDGTFRILLTGFWEVAEAVRLRPLGGGAQFHNFYAQFPILKGKSREWAEEHSGNGAEATPPTFLGWAGWLFATCYAPTSQVLWLVANWSSASAGLKVVRAIGVTVTALPLTMDTKARYGAALEERLGCWSRCVFSLMTAAACVVLGLVSAIELVKGIIEWNFGWVIKGVIILTYLIFALGMTYAGCSIYTPYDQAKSPASFRLGQTPTSFQWALGGLVMGAFAGTYTAGPAFILMMTSRKTPGLGIGEYIRCEPESVWRKFTALFP